MTRARWWTIAVIGLLAPGVAAAQGLPKYLLQRGVPVPVPGLPGYAYRQMPDSSTAVEHLRQEDAPRAGTKLLNIGGVPVPVPSMPGYAYGQMPDGSLGLVRLQGAPVIR